MMGGTPADVRLAVGRARAEAGSHRLIVSASCVLPLAVPETNIAATRAAVEVTMD